MAAGRGLQMGPLCLCLLMGLVLHASAFLLTGTIRDYVPGTTDFGTTITNVASKDASTLYVATDLSFFNKPVFTGTATSTSAATFPLWWNTPITTTTAVQAASIQPFVLDLTGSGAVSTYTADPFWPIDGILLGNDMPAGTGGHNGFFTLEVAGVFTFTTGLVFNFQSADDMYVFMNDKLVLSLKGIHTKGSVTPLTLTSGLAGMADGTNYEMRVFYAHRSSDHPPMIMISMAARQLCNALTAASPALNVYPFSASNLILNGPTTISATGLELNLTTSTPSLLNSGTSVWSSGLQRITSGFVTDFNVRIVNKPVGGYAQGFTFALQRGNGGLNARGGSSSNLGYSGLDKIIAIEFDTNKDSAVGDPSYNHVEVHSRYSTATTDTTQASSISPLFAITPTTNLPVISDGAVHAVHIEYAPGATGGNLKIWVDQIYVYAVDLDATAIATMSAGLVYVGFTGSTEPTVYGDTIISNWRFYAVPAAAPATTAEPTTGSYAWRTQVAAAAQPTAFQTTVTARDTCGGVSNGVGGASITANLRVIATSALLTSNTAKDDNGDGTYDVWFWYTSTSTPLALDLYLNGQLIKDSPFLLTIIPGAPAAAQSLISSPTVASLATWAAGTGQQVQITLKDQYGNLVTATGAPIIARFANGADISPVSTTPTPPYLYTFNVVSNVASSTSFLGRLGGQDVSNSPIACTISTGSCNGNQSLIAGTGLIRATCGAASTITITPRDIFQNYVSTQCSPDVVFSLINDTDGNTASGVSYVAASFVAANGATPAYYTMTYTPTKKGNYRIAATLANAPPFGLASLTALYASPGVVTAAQSVVVISKRTSVAGAAAGFVIQARDANSNDRDGSNDVAQFGVRIQLGSNTANYITCTNSATTASGNVVDTTGLTCVFEASGRYVVSFTGITAGNYTVTVVYPYNAVFPGVATYVGGSGVTYVMTVIPSNADPAYTRIDTASVPASMQAGVTGTFTVTTFDVYGNIRGTDQTTDTDGGIIDVSITLNAGTAKIYLGTITKNGAVYTIPWYGTTVGTYSIVVRLTTAVATLVNSPRTVTMTPGVVNATRCVISGAALTGAQGGGTSSFAIQARDSYDNNLAGTAALFTVQIRGFPSTPITTPTLTMVAGGITQANGFAVPAYNVLYPFYNIRVVVTSNGDLVANRNVTCVTNLASNAGTAMAAAPVGLGNGYFYNRLPVTLPSTTDQLQHIFFIEHHDISAPTVCVSGSNVAYSVQITHELGASFEQGTFAGAQISPSCRYQVSFNQVKLGRYNVTIFGDAAETEESKAHYGWLTVVQGTLAARSCVITGLPTTVVAGTPSSYTVQLKDINGNSYTSSLTTSTISIQFATSGTGCTRGAVTDNGDGTYTLAYTCTKAGTELFNTLSSTPAENLGAQDVVPVNVLAGPFAASASTVQYPAADMTAGVASSIVASLRDIYGNPINSGADLSIQVQAHSNLTITTTFLGVGQYRIGFTPTYARQVGRLTISVYNGGVLFNTSTIQVNPGEFSPVYSYVTGLSTTPGAYRSGAIFIFSLFARDAFNNTWFTAQPTVPNVVCILSTGLATPVTAGAAGTGRYYIQASSIPAILLGFTLFVKQGNAQVQQSSINGLFAVQIYAGRASAPQTVSNGTTDRIGVPGTWTAGYSRSIGFQLRDAGTQTTLPNALKYGLAISLDSIDPRFYEITSDAKTLTCIGVLPDPAYDVTTQFYSQGTGWIDHNDGTFELNIRTTRSSLYALVLFVNGEQHADCVRVDTIFTITPDIVDAANSKINGSAFYGIAGTVVQLSVTMRDQYGNQVLSGGNTVVVGGLPAADCASQTASFLTLPSASFTEETKYDSDSATYIPTGVYVASFSTTTAQFYTVVVTVNGALVGAPGTCLQLQIVPATPNEFFALGGGLAYAAIPYTLRVFAKDAYKNNVTTGAFYYETTLLRINDAAPISDYKLVVDSVANSGGWHDVTFVSAWQGSYEITIVLKEVVARSNQTTLRFPALGSGFFIILPATCAASDITKPYRCPGPPKSDYSCQSAPTTCPSYAAYQSIACNGLTQCVDPALGTTTCRATEDLCTCPTGTVACANGGHCVLTALSGQCPPALSAGTCPSGSVLCPQVGPSLQDCRATLNECPSLHVCPPGYFICRDRQTCTLSAALCPDTSSVVCYGNTPYVCPDGRCVISAESCGTGVTCPGGSSEKVCPDGTCVTDASQCPALYVCYAPTPMRCPDGSCRVSLGDCPSPIVCPRNWVLCANHNCAPTLASCSSVDDCPRNTTRCSDGSCKPNLGFCGTSVTCDLANPVLCGDRSCVTDGELCLKPQVCNAVRPYACPDGSCALSLAFCPTAVTCPPATPVLCPDQTCKATRLGCTLALPDCPSHLPIKCTVGGVCRARLDDCPTASQCSTAKPVRCPDGRCAVASDACVDISLLTCSVGVRCPGGECAASLTLCPTHVTCPPSTVRCFDGTCRASCSALVEISVCTATQVICPQATQGIQCANTLNDCPQAIVCGSRAPVRCLDQSCAASYEDCPAVTTYSAVKVACPGGFWASKISQCGTPTTCPSRLPTKCWDETCRVLPTDCPPAPACPATSPYLCPTGECQDNLYSCLNGFRCDLATGNGVKCPAFVGSSRIAACTSNVSFCFDTTSLTLAPSLSAPCPDLGRRCKDGSCLLDGFSCKELQCPRALPYRCTDGLCAKNLAQCNALNGCPFDEPIKCPDGHCARTATVCGTSVACATGLVRCDDGSCQSSLSNCPLANGCAAGFVRCLDGACLPVPANSGALPCVGTYDDANACPTSRPFRCSNGLCALSSYLCPHIPPFISLSNVTCGATIDGGVKPVRCADESCRYSGLQCPTMRPCSRIGTAQVRCGDGTCRLSGACPTYNSCPVIRPYRCLNGLCAVDVASCVDDYSGCPANAYKCPLGSCIPAATVDKVAACLVLEPATDCATLYPDTANVTCALDGNCVDDADLCRTPNGCSKGAPFLCSDGACSAIPCLTTSFVCGAAGPFRCANGRCAANAAACVLANGCPATTPIRCADNTCNKFPAHYPLLQDASLVCKPTITCPENAPVKCADGQCVTDSKYCRGLHQCITGTLCRDMTCRTACDASLAQQCPPIAPALCPDGSCKVSISECLAVTRQQAASNPCTIAQVLCADGTCASGWLACGAKTFAVFHPTGSWTATMNHNGNNTCMALPNVQVCADGSCVAHKSLCPTVPRCPEARPWRCPDGSCNVQNSLNTTSCAVVASCATGLTRCEDGYCRPSCLAFDGCPLSAPFFCAGKKLPCLADFKTCQTALLTLSPVRRRLLDTSTLVTGPEACSSDCYKYLPSIPQTVIVPWDEQTIVDVSLDLAGVSRTVVTIPSGALRTTQTFTVKQLTMLTLDRPGYSFAQKILTTPFACSTGSGVTPFALNVTVESTADIRLYNENTGQTTITTVSSTITTPCELQAGYIASAPIAGTSQRCDGPANLGATATSLTCDSSTFDGTVVSLTSPQAWTGTNSKHCLCVNITSASGNSYTVNSVVCTFFVRAGDVLSASILNSGASICPTEAQIAAASGVTTYNFARQQGTADACSGTVSSTVQNIDPEDICLATIDPGFNNWRCIEGRNERVLYPTWSATAGRPQNRLQGRISTCTYQAYAFVHIPLPDLPGPYVEPFDWWAKWGVIVLSVLGSVLFVAIVSAYSISRLLRYRRKYREKKVQLDQLNQRAQDLDEYAGGLGIADEEVDMVANPLVVEMQELERQVKAINDDISKEGDENAAIDELERERQRIYAEITKIKEQLAKDQAAAQAARVSVSGTPTGVAPGAAATAGAGAGAPAAKREQPKRHDFGDAKRPARKKKGEE